MIAFTTRRIHAQRGARRGAVLVMVALMLTALLGFGAFAIDLSQVMAYRSELQRSADAAALAGAVKLATASPQLADDEARSYSALNPVMGASPTITVELGKWTGTSLTSAHGGDGSFEDEAIRVQLSSTSPSIFARFLGSDSATVQAEAIAWVSPRVELTDCVKPFAIPYQALTATIDPFGNVNRPLSQNDLNAIRRIPTTLTFCLKEGELCDTSDTPTPGAHLNSFLVMNLGGSQGSIGNNIESCVSRRLGPDSVLSVLSSNSDDYVSTVSDAKDVWCNQFGTVPCVMKVILYDASDPLASLCVAAVTGQCKTNRIASIVITQVRAGASANPLLPPRVILEGYFAPAIDHGTVGTRPTTLMRPVLVR